MAWTAPTLAPPPARGRVGRCGGCVAGGVGWVVRRRRRQDRLGSVREQGVGGVVRFGASSEEAVAEVADLGLELGDLLLENVFALSRALMQGLIVMGLLSEGDSFAAVRAG